MDAGTKSSIAALSCGNLPTVARAMRERYPAARLVILADLGNGQKDAEDAARSVGGLVAVPDFGPNRPDDATDFNDMAALRGLEAVRRCIEAARAEAEAAYHLSICPKPWVQNISADFLQR